MHVYVTTYNIFSFTIRVLESRTSCIVESVDNQSCVTKWQQGMFKVKLVYTLRNHSGYFVEVVRMSYKIFSIKSDLRIARKEILSPHYMIQQHHEF